MLRSGCPSAYAASCSRSSRTALGRKALLAPPTCGVMRTPGLSHRGWSAGRGSGAVTSIDGLLGLAQFGNVEFHTWGSHVPDVEHVDQIIFDLDPDEDLAWTRVVDAARLTRGLLDELGLPAYLKTTGGKGLHVVVPLKPTRDWEQAKRFSQALAQQLARVAPERFTAQLSKNRRGGKIFIDYLRNGRGATAIAAYSLRARPGAPVSMPVAWDRLAARRDIRGDVFNLRNAPGEVAAAEAAWGDMKRRRATLTARMFAALGIKP